jgi:hypothetical protein
VFILQIVKVLCFDTLLQVLILKGDSGIAGALAEFFGPSISLQTIFLGNVGGKGVRRLTGYFMGYYTIWLAPVKRIFVPFWEIGKTVGASRGENQVPHTARKRRERVSGWQAGWDAGCPTPLQRRKAAYAKIASTGTEP